MIQFLSDNVDQLDLALDQLAVADRNFDRFALMLVDNVVELTLHRFIQDKATENRLWSTLGEPKHDPTVVEKALGQNFDEKAKGARKLGLLNESQCESILNLHGFRNTSYHKGLRHAGILHSLAIFYFRNACELLSKYEPRGWSSSSTDKISYRAKKYVGEKSWSAYNPDEFIGAYKRLDEVVATMAGTLVGDLAADMTKTIESIDEAIDYLATGGPKRMSRDEVIIDAQAWPFAFTEEAKEFARNTGCQEKTVAGFVEWIARNYNWPEKSDPVPRWRARLESLSSEEDEHMALKKYCDFMRQTEGIRGRIMESTAQLDMYVDEQIERARGK